MVEYIEKSKESKAHVTRFRAKGRMQDELVATREKPGS